MTEIVGALVLSKFLNLQYCAIVQFSGFPYAYCSETFYGRPLNARYSPILSSFAIELIVIVKVMQIVPHIAHFTIIC